MAYNYDLFVLSLPGGSYTGANLASGIQDLLIGFAVTFVFEVLYHPAGESTTIESNNEGMDSHSKFHIPSGFGIKVWMSSTNNGYPWEDNRN